MRTAKDIDAKIAALKQELDTVEGTETEIYTRIVGYYRSVKNWNRGKREEYNYRKLFSVPGLSDAETATEGTDVSSYIYFYRKSCPNCPPVRHYLEGLEIQGAFIDVDTEEGMEKAREFSVLSTPTVVLFDGDNKEMSRARDVRSIQRCFSRKEAVTVS
jgi:thiol-disulfide isomerase/thioredoxin